MKRFGRFIILAVLGFVLGAGLAYFQGMQEAKKAATAETQVTTNALVAPQADAIMSQTETAMSSIPSEASSEMALNEGASDVMAAEAPAAGETVAAVAGSTVGGAFSLTDHNGNAVTEASWPGKYKLVFFGFTHCPDICPATLDKITTALTAMGDEAAKVQPLFITTDPARDDTATVKQFVSGYHPSIVGLTGTEAQLNATIDAYKVFASKVPGPTEGDYKIEHSSYVFLMSPDDKMLEIFKTEDTAETIADKTKQHVAAAPAPAAEPAAEEGTPGMKDGEPNNAGGANETEVPGDLIPEKPQTPPEVIDESVPMDTAPATEAPASEEPATTEE